MEISEEDEILFTHVRKSYLFNNGSAYKKADSDTNFDVTMGAYDGAETSELVGLYILQVLSHWGNVVCDCRNSRNIQSWITKKVTSP